MTEQSPQNPLGGVHQRILKNIEGNVNIFSGLDIKGGSVYHHILNNALNNANGLSFARAARLGKEEIADAKEVRDRNIELIRQLEELPMEIILELQAENDVHKIAKKYCGSDEKIDVQTLMNGLASL